MGIVTDKALPAYYIARGCFYVQKKQDLPEMVVRKKTERQRNPSAAPFWDSHTNHMPYRYSYSA